MNLSSILKKTTIEEMENILKDLQNDHSFGAGYKKSAISRELQSRRITRRMKKA